MKYFWTTRIIRLIHLIGHFIEPRHLGIYWKLMKIGSSLNASIATKINETEHVFIHMTAFDAEKTIEQAIQSVLDQVHQNWKLVIIDDKSSDRTPLLIKSFRDPRITHVLNTENKRQWSNRNVAISHGLQLSPKPTYFTSIDSDDIAEPNWLSDSLKLFTSDSIIGIRPLIERVHEDSLNRLWEAPACQQTMWRREVFETIGGYRTKVKASDSDFMNRARRLAYLQNRQILLSTFPLQKMRHREESWSGQYSEEDRKITTWADSGISGLYSPLLTE